MNKARINRLNKAKLWLPQIDISKHIISKYRKHFKVDPICAVVELRLLGFDIPDVQLESFKKEQIAKAKRRRQRKEQELFPEDSDEYFYYIAGYTSGGVPYGITWEEYETMEKEEPKETENLYEKELPF